MSLKIAIVEDEDPAAQALKNCLEGYLSRAAVRKILPDISIRCFSGIMDFLEPYTGYDLVFMDIEMPGINGMDGAEELRRLDRDVRLVFVTNMAQYALNGYLVNASDFILKPVSGERLAFCLDRLLPVLLQNEEKTVVIRQGSSMKRLKIQEIAFVEVTGHTLKYHMVAVSSGEKEPPVIYETRGKLAEVEPELSAAGFLRCHNSFLINPRHVEQLDGYEIRMGNETVPISHPRKKQFMDQLNLYFTSGGI